MTYIFNSNWWKRLFHWRPKFNFGQVKEKTVEVCRKIWNPVTQMMDRVCKRVPKADVQKPEELSEMARDARTGLRSHPLADLNEEDDQDAE